MGQLPTIAGIGLGTLLIGGGILWLFLRRKSKGAVRRKGRLIRAKAGYELAKLAA